MNVRELKDLIRVFKQINAPQYGHARGSCWEWGGLKNAGGYGVIGMNGTSTVLAHRFIYEFYCGEKIPVGLMACHHCDNPSCVNPAHIFIGTASDNMHDCMEKGRHRHGGKLTPDMVLAIRKLRKETGMSYERIGKKFGIRGNVAQYAVYGWKSVVDPGGL